MILFFLNLWFGLAPVASVPQSDKNRIINYQDTAYTTSYTVDTVFFGTYSGKKTGYLTLNSDGTGEYKYDIFGFAPATCERVPIKIIWGFILDDNGSIVKNKRDYGYSFPILMQSVGTNSFQGCRKVVMKDFILQRGKELHVSSSDDWKKVLE
jgi:hypothetical protein